MAKAKTTIMERLKGGYVAACEELGKTRMTIDQFAFLGDQAARYFALHKIETMIEAINQGHQFDWTDWDEEKWFPYWIYSAASGWSLADVLCVGTGTDVGARLVTRSAEHARFVAEVMIEEYKIYIQG